MQKVAKKSIGLNICLQQFYGVQPISNIKVSCIHNNSFSAVSFAGAQLELKMDLQEVPGRPDARDGVFTVLVKSGEAKNINLSVEVLENAWSKNAYVMLPAVAYNGNRFKSRQVAYPPLPNLPEDRQEHPDIVISDLPQLNINDGQLSQIHVLTGDETTPCLCYYSPSAKHACILLTNQGGRYGNYGIKVIESKNRNSASFIIESPAVRPSIYSSGDANSPSPDNAAILHTGESISIHFRLLIFPADCIQDIYTRFAQVRKDLTGSVSLLHNLPFSASWSILEKKYNCYNWNESYGYYAVGTKNFWEGDNHNRNQDWQVGWTGGGMNTLPLLAAGDKTSRKRALSTLDFMFNKVQSKSGLFYAGYHQGKIFHDAFKEETEKNWVMVRKNADALYFLIKHFIYLRKDVKWKLPEHWDKGTRKLSDCLTKIYDRYYQFGQFLDVDTGDIIVGGSTSGALAPGALALAGQFFNEKRYIDVAIKSAINYYHTHVRAGVTTGGPGEIMQAPDSESAFAMLETLVVIFEVTKDRSWLSKAIEMADQCMSWCASYDYKFPETSYLGKLDIRAAGSVWANVQNKHSAPGICILSGDSLFKLYRATGEKRFLELITEISHNLPQYLCREDRQVGNPDKMKPGWICERVNFSDWEGCEQIGGNLFCSCWPEVSLALTNIEIPGLYVQTDTGLIQAIDHIHAELISLNNEIVKLKLSNPTSFDAEVRIMAETSETAQNVILGQMYVVDLPSIKIPAGASTRFETSQTTSKTAERSNPTFKSWHKLEQKGENTL